MIERRARQAGIKTRIADGQPLKHVLVHAGASGVGTALCQVARQAPAHADIAKVVDHAAKNGPLKGRDRCTHARIVHNTGIAQPCTHDPSP